MRHTLLHKAGQYLRRQRWKQTAFRSLCVALVDEAKELQGVTIVPPDFRDPRLA